MSDPFSDIKESTKTFIDDRLKNPYITAVIAVWFFTNRVLVYGIFNFSDEKTFDEKLSWISSQLNSFERFGYKGMWIGIVWALIWGIISMLVFNLITGFGKASYKWINRTSIWMLQKVEPAKWRPIKELDDELEKNSNLTKSNKELKKEIDRLEEQNKNQNIKVNEQRNELLEKDTKVKELTDTTINNGKNSEKLESQIEVQKKAILDKEQIIQNHIIQDKMNTEAIQKLEKELKECKAKLPPSNSKLYIHSGWEHKDIKEHFVVSTNTIFNARIILNKIGQTCTIYIGLKIDTKRYWLGFSAGKNKSSGVSGIEYNSTRVFDSKEIVIEEYIMSLFSEAFPNVNYKSMLIDCVRLRGDKTDLSDIIFNYNFI